MALRYENGVRRAIGLSAVIGMMIWMTGCMTQAPRVAAPPVQGDLVGGGLKIEWTAPARGTAYLVEATTNRIMETRSLERGQTYSFSASSDSQKGEFERIFGVRPAQARFLLYFQSAQPKDLVQ
jgi:predicted Abi (CAAX) family protease